MEKALLKRMAAMLLCMFFGMSIMLSMGAAYASDAGGISVQILLPADWANRSTSAKVCIDDGADVGFSSVQVKIGQNGGWKDITNELERQENRCYGTVTITENCTVHARVTSHDGQVYENSRYIECFDRTPPTVQGRVKDGSLQVECGDDLSGVSEVIVSGKSYTYPARGVLNIPLKDIGSSAQITLQAADRAGNTSSTAQIKIRITKSPRTANPNSLLPTLHRPTASPLLRQNRIRTKSRPYLLCRSVTTSRQRTVPQNR